MWDLTLFGSSSGFEALLHAYVWENPCTPLLLGVRVHLRFLGTLGLQITYIRHHVRSEVYSILSFCNSF